MKENREIIPLRTILQNCLNHIENLESNRAICDNYEKEFQVSSYCNHSLKCKVLIPIELYRSFLFIFNSFHVKFTFFFL